MRIALSLIFCLTPLYLLFGQVVFSTDWKSEADVVIYVSEWKSEADLIVYKTDWKSEANKNNGIWFFTEWKKGGDKRYMQSS